MTENTPDSESLPAADASPAEEPAAAGPAAAVAETDQGIRKIDAQELLRVMDEEPGPVILDVRSPEEYRASHIPGAINIP